MKLKAAEDFGPLGVAHDTGVRLRRYYAPDTELDRNQLARALDCASDALLVIDGFGRICAANAAAAALLGVEAERLRHNYVQSQLAALDREDSLLDAALTGPRSLEVSLPDGGHARANLTALANDRGEPTHVCIALAPIDRAQPALDAVGRLVAELAHDINNQLSAALNYVFILRRRVASDPELSRHVDELQSTAWRAASLTSGLKLFGPKRNGDAERLDVCEVIATLAPVLVQAAGACRLALELPANLRAVRLARGHLEQLLVITTLAAVTRARGSGSITLSVATRGSSLRVAWELAAEPGGAAAVLASFAPAPRVHGTLRRALKRCRAVPGHDATHIWFDLETAS